MRQGIGQGSAEISYPFGISRNLRGEHDAAAFATPLLIPEKENPVLLDRATEVEAIVVVFQLRFWLTCPIQEEIRGVQFIAAIKLEASAVKLIAAAFSDEINDRALRLTVLGAEAITLNAKLLNRIDRRKDQQRSIRPDIHV